MCLLSVYSPGALVNVEHLEAGACDNPDGYGFAIIANGRIEVAHGMDAFATIEAFDNVRSRHPESWAMFHSRYTTDGVTTVDNCHPFLVGGDPRTVLGHNGILPDAARPLKGDDRSDTRILAEDLIPARIFGRMHRTRALRNLGRWIASEGYANKVAIMTVDPRYKGNMFILGEKHGNWVDGVWHSNSGYIPWQPRRSPNHSTDPWYAFLAGKISYEEYKALKYEEPKLLAVCLMCDSSQHVDQAYMYCGECKMCLDCLTDLEGCDCWVPASKRVEVPGLVEATEDDGELSPVAVEAALANLPADQAARVRDALAENPS